MKKHAERKHSKFSASGAERWTNCPGSVPLSEGLPDKSSKWAVEGTLAHEVLEKILTLAMATKHAESPVRAQLPVSRSVTDEMVSHALTTAQFIKDFWKKIPRAQFLVETRIYLKFIHPEMFGTFDSAIVDYFDTLHIFDYKYGAGHAVSPIKNLQMIFYGLGLAHTYQWNFKQVRLWIIQPRIRGYDGPTFWEISIEALRRFVPLFEKAVKRVEREPNTFIEGSWCHWCRAKGICPLKNKERLKKAKGIFKPLKQKIVTAV